MTPAPPLACPVCTRAWSNANAARREAILAARTKGNKDIDLSKVADTSWKGPYRAQIAQESDATVREAMVVAYFAYGTDKEVAEDVALAKQAMTDVPATSPLWAMDSGAVLSMTGTAGDPAASRTYVDAVVAGITDPTEGGELLFGLMWNARNEGRHDEVTHYYGVLHERFPTSRYIGPAAMFDPNKKVRPGAPIPDFDPGELRQQLRALHTGDVQGQDSTRGVLGDLVRSVYRGNAQPPRDVREAREGGLHHLEHLRRRFAGRSPQVPRGQVPDAVAKRRTRGRRRQGDESGVRSRRPADPDPGGTRTAWWSLAAPSYEPRVWSQRSCGRSQSRPSSG